MTFLKKSLPDRHIGLFPNQLLPLLTLLYMYIMTNVTIDEIPSYNQFKRALLLGEGDFSFARAFVQVFGGHVNATEYGEPSNVAMRYFDGNLQKFNDAISQLGKEHQVMTGVNARLLASDECTCRRWNATLQTWNEEPTLFWNKDDTFDLIIFNFPHSKQAGRATRLVRALLKQVRKCVETGKLPLHVVLEMRLRDQTTTRNVRALYKHEEAAKECGFTCVGCFPSDLHKWDSLGYQHVTTKRNATCRDIGNACNVWRWKCCT
jgi:hypothetical protein